MNELSTQGSGLYKHKPISESVKHGRPQFNEEVSSNVASRNRMADQLVETWARARPGMDLAGLYVKDKGRARRTAIGLQMQEVHLSNLSETQISNAFKTTPENVLRIVRIGIANSNRANFATEWQCTTTDDAVYFVDKVYTGDGSGGTLRGGKQGERIYDNIAPNYATEKSLEASTTNGGQGDGTIKTFVVTSSIVPIVPFSVKILQGGKLVSTDDGDGKLIGSTLDTGGVINYNTGVISVIFITAPISGESIDFEYNWDSEDKSNFGKFGRVELQVSKKRFNCRPQPLGYSYSKMVELTLETSGLGSVDDMLISAVGDEHAMRKDYKAIQLFKRIGLGNPIATFDADFAAAGEDNDYNHSQRILTTIGNVSGDIYNSEKRGQINRIIAAPGVLEYLKKHKLWSTDNSQPRVPGSYFAGMLDDIEVYVSPADPGVGLLSNNEAILTYKNTDEEGDISIAFGVLTEMMASLDYPEFYRVGTIATVEDQMIINSKFVRILRIDNL